MPTICPIAIAVGCQKCPVYKVCPVTSIIGDQAPRKPEQSLSRSAPKKVSKRTLNKKKKH
jgi:hypothetical protein